MAEVLSTTIWGVPPAGGPLLLLPTAQAGSWNSPNSYLRNLANDRTPRAVQLGRNIYDGSDAAAAD